MNHLADPQWLAERLGDEEPIDTNRIWQVQDEALQAAQKRWSRYRGKLDTFAYLCGAQTPMLVPFRPRLFRRHCDEMLERIARGQAGRSLEKPTRAELLAILSKWTYFDDATQERLFLGALGERRLGWIDRWRLARIEQAWHFERP